MKLFKKLKNNFGLKLQFIFINPSQLNIDQKTILLEEINALLKNAWGKFERDFIEKHILSTELVTTARIGNELIGFCVINKKKILNRQINYIEFTVIRKDFQKLGLGTRLVFLALRKIIFKNIFWIILKPIEIMFITPNIRVLAKMAALADFIYPNPYSADKATGKITSADDETWIMAQELIKMSDNPNRRLDKEGLVLHGSYASTPWLIYNDDQIPWHRDGLINKFAKHYLGYGKREDKEFVVRARLGIKMIYKYLMS